MANEKNSDVDPVKSYLSQIGRKGGKATAKKPKGLAALKESDRSAIAKKGAAARWGKKAAATKKTTAKKAIRKRTS